MDLTVSAGSVPPGGWGREQWSRQWRVRGRRWWWRWRRWWCGGGGAGGRGRLVGAPVEQSAASSTHLTQLACSVDASESRELKWREAASGWWAEKKKKKEAANANPPLLWTTSFSCRTETCERAVLHTIGVYTASGALVAVAAAAACYDRSQRSASLPPVAAVYCASDIGPLGARSSRPPGARGSCGRVSPVSSGGGEQWLEAAEEASGLVLSSERCPVGAARRHRAACACCRVSPTPRAPPYPTPPLLPPPV